MYKDVSNELTTYSVVLEIQINFRPGGGCSTPKFLSSFCKANHTKKKKNKKIKIKSLVEKIYVRQSKSLRIILMILFQPAGKICCT